MPSESLDDLSPLQRRIMAIVWELEEASVHDVRRALSSRNKRPAYTTVLSVMQKLEKAGWLDHRADGKAYTYFPTRTRRKAGQGSVKEFVDRVFDGDTFVLFQHLLEDERLSESELAELRKLIEKRKKELRDGGK
jgi:predicted transcriptional regulator